MQRKVIKRPFPEKQTREGKMRKKMKGKWGSEGEIEILGIEIQMKRKRIGW